MLVVPCPKALELNPPDSPFVKPAMKTDMRLLQSRERCVFFLICLTRRGTILYFLTQEEHHSSTQTKSVHGPAALLSARDQIQFIF